MLHIVFLFSVWVTVPAFAQDPLRPVPRAAATRDSCPMACAGVVGMWEREDVGRVGIEWYYRLFVNGENLARSFGLLRR